MSQGRIVFVPVVADLAAIRPPSVRGSNNRQFTMPAVGECLHWPTRNDSTGAIGGPVAVKLLEMPNLPGYSMLILDDWIERTVDQSAAQQQGGGTPMQEKLHDGRVLAADLAAQWEKYGVVQIVGTFPTESELTQARAQRAAYARHHAAQVEERYRRGQAGKPDGITEYTEADRAWASECGVKLSDVFETMKKAEAAPEMKACWACAEEIRAAAVKCRFCGEDQTSDPALEDRPKEENRNAKVAA